MTIEELDKLLQERYKGKYGILAPPLTDRETLDILTKHLLGNWYSVNPIGREQVNTEMLFEILRLYPDKRKQNYKFKFWRK